jgi:hypothetical protein
VSDDIIERYTWAYGPDGDGYIRIQAPVRLIAKELGVSCKEAKREIEEWAKRTLTARARDGEDG